MTRKIRILGAVKKEKAGQEARAVKIGNQEIERVKGKETDPKEVQKTKEVQEAKEEGKDQDDKAPRPSSSTGAGASSDAWWCYKLQRVDSKGSSHRLQGQCASEPDSPFPWKPVEGQKERLSRRRLAQRG